MTEHLIYGKQVRIQADQSSINSPTTVTGGLTADSLTAPFIVSTAIQASGITVNDAVVNSLLKFPILAPSTQFRLEIVDSAGAGIIGNPATGAPFVIPANAFRFIFFMGLSQNSGNLSFLQGTFGPTNGVSATVTITAAGVGSSLLVPGWIPLGYRPGAQQRIPIFAQVGPVAQPTTLIFQLETNGDVRIFKDTISTNWNNNDTFTVNTVSPFIIQAPFPL